MTDHDLKCWPEPYAALADGCKRFEYRRDDRGYAKGDRLLVREWSPDTGRYSGRCMLFIVTYILRDSHGVPPGYCVMSLSSGVAGFDSAA